jgi:D-lactate dehydrogenase
MKSYDVFFYECFEEEEAALRKFMAPSLNCGFSWQAIQETDHRFPPAKLISIRTQSIIPSFWRTQLTGILTRSQGYDHLVAYQKENRSDIQLGFLEEYCSREVAEHAIMAMLVIMRKLKKQIKQFDSFCRDGITGQSCQNKTALIVGVGKIGSNIAEICSGLRMKVEGVDIDQSRKNIQYVELNDGIKRADILFVSVPLTELTRGIIDYPLVSKAKPGMILINVSRGEITPAQDMKDLLDENILGGLGMDVFPAEKEFAQHLRGNKTLTDRSGRLLMELSRRDNVLFTPHNAFNTEESVLAKAKLSMESINMFLAGKGFLWPIVL